MTHAAPRILLVEGTGSLSALCDTLSARLGRQAGPGGAPEADGSGRRRDVVLLDLSPPGGDGLRLLRAARPGAAQAKIVMIADGPISRTAEAISAHIRDALAGPSGDGGVEGAGAAAVPVAAAPRPGGFAEPAEDPDALAAPAAAGARAAAVSREQAIAALVGQTLHSVERAFIEATIAHCGGSLPAAARTLNVSPSTLYRKRAAWGAAPRRR